MNRQGTNRTNFQPMKTPTIIAGGRSGCLFEGENPLTFCFVPEYCISDCGDRVQVSEGDYLRSGWDVRNMRFNDAGEGQHLFPNMSRPIFELDSEPVKTFLQRIAGVPAF